MIRWITSSINIFDPIITLQEQELRVLQHQLYSPRVPEILSSPAEPNNLEPSISLSWIPPLQNLFIPSEGGSTVASVGWVSRGMDTFTATGQRKSTISKEICPSILTWERKRAQRQMAQWFHIDYTTRGFNPVRARRSRIDGFGFPVTYFRSSEIPSWVQDLRVQRNTPVLQESKGGGYWWRAISHQAPIDCGVVEKFLKCHSWRGNSPSSFDQASSSTGGRGEGYGRGANDGRFRDTDPPPRLPRHARGVLAYKFRVTPNKAGTPTSASPIINRNRKRWRIHNNNTL